MKRGIVAGRLVEAPTAVEGWEASEGSGWAWSANAVLEPSGEVVRGLMVSDASARRAKTMIGRPLCPYALGDLVWMVVYDGTGFAFGRFVESDEAVGVYRRKA